ncbi:MAG: hypothetical protein L0338_34750 [Acidobacteria bacterium]|nr:hypothetical protein [Acidobacteriota bacterium]
MQSHSASSLEAACQTLFVVVSFGVRHKIKPLSSLLTYIRTGDDHSAAPTQVATLGSYVYLEALNHYVSMEFEKHPE